MVTLGGVLTRASTEMTGATPWLGDSAMHRRPKLDSVSTGG